MKLAILSMIAMIAAITVPSAFASHGSSPAACEADGYEAGRDGPFSQELYEQCGEVGGTDCESATDAGE